MLPIHRCQGHQSVRTRQVTLDTRGHSRAGVFVRSFGYPRIVVIPPSSHRSHASFQAIFRLKTAHSRLPARRTSRIIAAVIEQLRRDVRAGEGPPRLLCREAVLDLRTQRAIQDAGVTRSGE
jgi:hypothetical protein